MDGGSAGIWPTEPRLLADEPAAVFGYTDILGYPNDLFVS